MSRLFSNLYIIDINVPINVDIVDVQFDAPARCKRIIDREGVFVVVPSFRIPRFVLQQKFEQNKPVSSGRI